MSPTRQLLDFISSITAPALSYLRTPVLMSRSTAYVHVSVQRCSNYAHPWASRLIPNIVVWFSYLYGKLKAVMY